MKGYSTIYDLLLKWRYCIFFSLLLSLSACSEYEHSIYDPLSPEYVDLSTPVGQEVDLGLTVNWANHNVGADASHKYGGYYAWGETKMKHEYTEDNYLYRSGYSYDNIGSNISGTSYDVAHVRWKNGWRMPTRDEMAELYRECTWKSTTVNGVDGQLITGPNGNSIFLPEAGYCAPMIPGESSYYYWTSEQKYTSSVYTLMSNSFAYDTLCYSFSTNFPRYYGLPVRPVKSKTHKERTIAEIYEAGGGYSITRGVVIATSKQELIVYDETRVIPVLVDEGHSFLSGDEIMVEGIVKSIDGILKFKKGCEIDTIANSQTVMYLRPVEMDVTSIRDYISNPYLASIIYKGVLRYESGKYYVESANSSYRWSIENPHDGVIFHDDFINEEITVYGYTTGVQNNNTIKTVAKIITYVKEELSTGNLQITLNGNTFKMIKVEGGTFMMGASDVKNANERDLPAHPVALTDYYIAENEFTRGLHDAYYYGYNKTDNKFPRSISYNYAETIISIFGYATELPFQLPTEAQWEFAARGGNKSKGYIWSGSNNPNEVAWHNRHPSMIDTTEVEVASFNPNELGIYDMSGNLSEWCSDWYGEYTEDTVNVVTNPTGPIEGTGKVNRGGDYYNSSFWCRTTARWKIEELNVQYSNYGFRLCLDYSTEARTRQRNSPRIKEKHSLELLSPTMLDEGACIDKVSGNNEIKE